MMLRLILPVKINSKYHGIYSYDDIYKIIDDCRRDERILKFLLVGSNPTSHNSYFYSTIEGIDYESSIEEFYISIKVDDGTPFIETIIPNILITDNGLELKEFHCMIRSKK